MTTFEGMLPALVTPFRDGKVDHGALRALVERQLAGGASGLVACGTTGESATLSPEEQLQVVQTILEETRGRVPVVVGTGNNNTAKTIHLSEAARDLGADGLLIVCPYYNKPTQAGLEAHFRAILTAVPLPTILYNIPGRTGVDTSLETYAKLADLPALVAIKEATGNVLRAQQLVARFGDRYDVLSGDDALIVGIMAVGGKGVVTTTGNLFPKQVSELVRLMAAGDFASARRLNADLLPVFDALFLETNPGPLKAALAEVGLIAPEIRLPMVWPEPSTIERIRAALAAAPWKP